MIKIAAIQTQPLSRIALEYIFSKSDKFHFSQGFKTIDVFKNYNEKNNSFPDVIFVGGDIDSIQVKKSVFTLKEKFPKTKIVLFISASSTSSMIKAMQLEAHGYLFRNATLDEVNKCLDSVLMGNIYIQSNIKYVPQPHQTKQKHSFTKRELEVLELILQEKTSSEIADKLCVSISTIESHRANLFAKSGARNMVGLVKKSYQYGLIHT